MSGKEPRLEKRKSHYGGSSNLSSKTFYLVHQNEKGEVLSDDYYVMSIGSKFPLQSMVQKCSNKLGKDFSGFLSFEMIW